MPEPGIPGGDRPDRSARDSGRVGTGASPSARDNDNADVSPAVTGNTGGTTSDSPDLDAFLAHLGQERRLSPHTLSNYRRDLTGIAAWREGAGLGNILHDPWHKIWNAPACCRVREESAKMEHICQLGTTVPAQGGL